MVNLNSEIFQFIFGLAHQNIWLDRLGIFLAQYLPYLILISIIILVFKEPVFKRKMFLGVYLILVLILSRGIIGGAFNFFYPQERPFQVLDFEPLIGVTGSSFPSSHTLIFFSLAAVIFYYNKKYGVWYLLAASLIGVARIFVGVHWPIDVLFGIILGILSAVIIKELIKPYFSFKN